VLEFLGVGAENGSRHGIGEDQGWGIVELVGSPAESDAQRGVGGAGVIQGVSSGGESA
jgi:hypothetical protein